MRRGSDVAGNDDAPPRGRKCDPIPAGRSMLTREIRGVAIPTRTLRGEQPYEPFRLRTYTIREQRAGELGPDQDPSRGLSHRPVPVGGADWQPGVTRNAARYRVFLNGEPVVGATAARVKDRRSVGDRSAAAILNPDADGWVDVALGSFEKDDPDADPDYGCERTGRRSERRTGDVRLIRCDE